MATDERSSCGSLVGANRIEGVQAIGRQAEHSADAVCRVAYASLTECLYAVTKLKSWLDSVLAGLDDGSIVWNLRYCRSRLPSRELTLSLPDDP